MFCGSEYQCQSVSGIVSVQFLGAVPTSQIAYVPPLPAAGPEREMSKSFVGNLDNVPGNKNVCTAVVEKTFQQFNCIFDSSDIDIGIDVGQNLTKFE